MPFGITASSSEKHGIRTFRTDSELSSVPKQITLFVSKRIRFSIFRVNDDDGTKTLNRRELHRLVVQYGVKANADEVAELFEQLDTDGTGSISFDEFIASLRVSRFF